MTSSTTSGTAASPTIAITMGDPCGVGPELAVLGALARGSDQFQTLVVGDLERLDQAARILCHQGRLATMPKFQTGGSSAADDQGHLIRVHNLQNLPSNPTWGTVSADAGKASFEYLQEGLRMALAGEVDGICTAPINKKAWELAGIGFPGHTEALAQLSGTKDYAMMLRNQKLRVVHATTHIAFNRIVITLTPERIVSACRLARAYLTRIGILEPSIAVAGLNPHAGDHGLFGDEEERLILPAIQRAQSEGWKVWGPLPADTVFARAAQGEFDMVVALYHDQGHIAIKMLGLDTGVNQTLGLPIIRTSVDHGTAFDIAGQGKVRDESMIYAIRAAAEDARAMPSPPIPADC